MNFDDQATILVVDDHPANLSLLFDSLEQAGFRVLTAESGALALKRTTLVCPDMILLDVVMPEIDGFETCRQLKQREDICDIPVIFMTALTDTVEKIKGFEAGGVDYVTKPIQIEELLARIKAHLTIARLQRQLQEQNEQLEIRVQERTAELEAEIVRRQKQEEEKEQLLEVVINQSEQLRHFTGWLAQQQRDQQANLSQLLRGQLETNLDLLASHLELARRLYSDPAPPDVTTMIPQHLNDALTLLAQTRQSLHQAADSVDQNQEQLTGSLLHTLSSREQEVMKLIATGHTSPQIAEALNLSVHTVHTYRSRIMKKLNVHDVAGLTKLAMEHGLL